MIEIIVQIMSNNCDLNIVFF